MQGTAGTDETSLRYGWNYARLLAEGPSERALVATPVMRAMEDGAIARIEELTRVPGEVQDTLITILSEKTMPIPELSIEVQVWDEDTYRRLVAAGCDGLVVYQETYDRATYAAVHLKGKKRNYDWRLAAPDRGAAAGMRRLGVAALLGLHDDWRYEIVATAAHAPPSPAPGRHRRPAGPAGTHPDSRPCPR